MCAFLQSDLRTTTTTTSAEKLRGGGGQDASTQQPYLLAVPPAGFATQIRKLCARCSAVFDDGGRAVVVVEYYWIVKAGVGRCE